MIMITNEDGEKSQNSNNININNYDKQMTSHTYRPRWCTTDRPMDGREKRRE